MSETNPKYQQELLNAICRDELQSFVARCFETLNPGSKLEPEGFIDYITSLLEPLRAGKQLKLVVNLPPRHLKSTIISIALPAWLMGHNPALRVIVASYSDELAEKLSRDFRRIIMSDWYRELFPSMRIGDKDTASEVGTTSNGYRLGVSAKGTITGRGADIIIIDDPIKPMDTGYDSARDSVNEWFRSTLVSRLDKPAQGSIILVMQRLHANDLSGFLLETGEYKHICLPAIATADITYQLPHGTYVRKVGEALSPKLQPVSVLDSLKRLQGPSCFSAQYQQEPFASDGELIKPDYIQLYDGRIPESASILVSCDPAISTAEGNDYSAVVTCAYFNDMYCIIDVFRDRLELVDLVDRIAQIYRRYNAPQLLIEKQSVGISLIDMLRRQKVWAIPFAPIGSKEERVQRNLEPFISKRFFVSSHMPLLVDYQRELLSFPKGKHDDMVDATIQIFEHCRMNWLPPGITEVMIYHKDKDGRSNDQIDSNYKVPNNIWFAD